MRVKRIYNNNIALVEDDQGKEVVLVGRGIVFGKKKGDQISVNSADKVFHLKGENRNKFEQIIQDMPVEFVFLSEEIVSFIKENSDKKIDDMIYVTLTDHIANTVERIRMGIDFDMSVLLNVKSLYQKEYELGVKCVQMIRDTLDIKIDDSEASFIALHIINAQSESNMSQVSMIMKLLNELQEIVSTYFDLDTKNNLDYDRFLVHCRFFVQRIVNNEHLDPVMGNDQTMFKMMQEKGPRQCDCIRSISDHILKKYNYKVSLEEEFYLLIHLNKLTK